MAPPEAIPFPPTTPPEGGLPPEEKPRRRAKGDAVTIAAVALLLGVLAYATLSHPPFVAVASGSMQPSLRVGDLVLVEAVSPVDVQVGDVIVIDVDPEFRERYGYPSSVVHRVVEVREEGGLSFRTKGDNTAEDPFTVLPGDVRGRVADVLPRAGLAILYLKSPHGLTFLVSLVVIRLIYAHGPQARVKTRALKSRVSQAVFSDVLHQLDGMEVRQERSLAATSNALVAFSGAMEEYAKHLQSHTAAVKSMALAAQDIRKAVRHQEETLNGMLDEVRRFTRAPTEPTTLDDFDPDEEERWENDRDGADDEPEPSDRPSRPFAPPPRP